ncbi:hypothetical protein TELCIR_06176 [Teladorsagia circumcincta]|uniref:Uncharacterized protein n=1 Tax=Teladorsagia circumcincta TaxID=45464 RepID=A0A2G9UNT1_TELCI|nr:hypothetical protein TELCIR_06176 [Teladorsagia circumcincta]
MPSGGEQSRQPIMPVMLHSEEVKRVRELLIGTSATEELTIESNTTVVNAPRNLSREADANTEKEQKKDFPTLAPALKELEVAKESKKSPVASTEAETTTKPTITTKAPVTSTEAETTTKPTITTKAPKQVKLPSGIESDEVKKVKLLLAKAPPSSMPTSTTAEATTATTAIPTTVSVTVSSTQRSTTPKKNPTTTSKSLRTTTTTSRARTTHAATTRKTTTTPQPSTSTSWIVTAEPTQRLRPIW